MARPADLLRKLGHATVERVWRLGFAALTPQTIEESVVTLSTMLGHRHNRE